MNRRSARGWSWLVGGGLLVLVGWQTGTEPVVHGLRSAEPWVLALGAALALPTTLACAWRWRTVTRRLGADVALASAVASCYRAQFLNSTLPGGVLGDLHRGVRHGRSLGRTALGVRTVFWERTAGQVVLAVVALALVLILPEPVPVGRERLLAAALVVVIAAVVVVAVVRRRPSAWGTLGQDLGSLLHRRAWPPVVATSLVAVLGHLATFVLAARAVGVTTPLATLLPVAAVVLLAAGLPVNLAGWGPREGMAAWAFAAAGLGAGAGVATAVAYGAVALVATLPGALVLLLGGASRRPAESVQPAVATELSSRG